MKLTIAVAVTLTAAIVFLMTLDIHTTASAQTDCVESLPNDMMVDGTWTTNCTSSTPAPRGGERYARFYTFTLDSDSDVTIDLTSDADTYLYLRSGNSTTGDASYENDDIDTRARNFDSRIEETLSAGEYTIEATTYGSGITGTFTLTVTHATATAPTPAPSPTPDPTPDPTTPIPAGCTLQSFSGTSEEGSWTSDCVSENRTENGTHYASFFDLSVTGSAIYDITLESRTDPYLILLDDEGDVIDFDDDDDDNVFDLGSRHSGLRIALSAGDYIVEATTYGGSATGNFTLTIVRPEVAALEALYNSTDGANWTDNTNWLTGAPFSDWYGVSTDYNGRITRISLTGNNLVGTIPSELGRLNHLEGLFLGRNELSGSIPSELGDLSNLRYLLIYDNELTGSIPYQLGDLSSLEEMHLGRNKLSGSIPSRLGDLDNLRRLHLTVNDLSGNIPTSLGNLSNLRRLSIASKRSHRLDPHRHRRPEPAHANLPLGQ